MFNVYSIIAAVIIGLICGFLIRRALVNSMNTIVPDRDADEYSVIESFKTYNRRDHYLRTDLKATPRAKDSRR